MTTDARVSRPLIRDRLHESNGRTPCDYVTMYECSAFALCVATRHTHVRLCVCEMCAFTIVINLYM